MRRTRIRHFEFSGPPQPTRLRIACKIRRPEGSQEQLRLKLTTTELPLRSAAVGSPRSVPAIPDGRPPRGGKGGRGGRCDPRRGGRPAAAPPPAPSTPPRRWGGAWCPAGLV